MILESIVTSVDTSGRVNLAPMGPAVISGLANAGAIEPGRPDSVATESVVSNPDATMAFRLRPFRSSRTYRNLVQTRRAVIHVTDDSLLFAKAAIDRLSDEQVRQQVHRLRDTDWWPLIDCHRWFAVEVTTMTEDDLRASMDCRVVESKLVRPFFGFHRARHAVIEAAILATRTHLIPADEIRAEITRLQPLVDKTGGPVEHDAFDLLKATIDERLATRP